MPPSSAPTRSCATAPGVAHRRRREMDGGPNQQRRHGTHDHMIAAGVGMRRYRHESVHLCYLLLGTFVPILLVIAGLAGRPQAMWQRALQAILVVVALASLVTSVGPMRGSSRVSQRHRTRPRWASGRRCWRRCRRGRRCARPTARASSIWITSLAPSTVSPSPSAQAVPPAIPPSAWPTGRPFPRNGRCSIIPSLCATAGLWCSAFRPRARRACLPSGSRRTRRVLARGGARSRGARRSALY